jgi:hypothetical protein
MYDPIHQGVGVSLGSGVAVSVGVSVSVGVDVRVKVGVMVGVSLGIGVGVSVTAGRSMGPVVPSPSRSRQIHPPSYCRWAGFRWLGAIRSQVSSSLRALNIKHSPTNKGSPSGA